MTTLLNSLQRKEFMRSASRFAIVGMLGTLIDFTLFTLLSTGAGLPSLLANTISYSAGILNNYLLHRNWTFSLRPQKAAGKQFLQFIAISISALMVNNLIIMLLMPVFLSIFSDNGYAAIAAKLCAISVGICWNFLANHLWTFRSAR